MKKIAVIGGSGMVASRFIELSQERFDVTSLDEKTLDITNANAVNQYFTEKTFDAVVNFAAYTNVDGAEAQKGDKEGLVWKLNVEGPRHLSEVCEEKKMFLVHISTDFVFPGNEAFPGPYSEDAKLPENSEGIGWYGWTKNRAEKIVRETAVNSAIIRYGYPFRASSYDLKLDWARNLLNLYGKQGLYPLFEDQIYSILFIDDLTEPLSRIIEGYIPGVFHIASSNTTNPFETAKYLLEKYTGKQINLQKGSMKEFLAKPGTTPRPRLGGLTVGKTETAVHMKFKSWEEMVDEFLFQEKK